MSLNSNFVLPRTYLLGQTAVDFNELLHYLEDTHQEEFLNEVSLAKEQGLSDGEILTSFYAKACYASLTTSKNANITKTRTIWDNILATIQSGHGSVFEHVNLNFMIHNCSRVFTHEQVRHRVGTAFSQTSGRYVRSDELKIVFDPILQPIEDLCEDVRRYLENWYQTAQIRLGLIHLDGSEVGDFDFATKKKLTSALRRFLPNGQANEMGHSCNLRTLRNVIQMRTNRHAEWEIRVIYNQIAEIARSKFKLLFADANYEMADGILEITFENGDI